MLNDVPVSLQRQHDADRRGRHREHDDERIAQRLVLRRHDGVDEHQRQDQHHAAAASNALRLLLDLGAEADAEVLRHARSAAGASSTASTASLSVDFRSRR